MEEEKKERVEEEVRVRLQPFRRPKCPVVVAFVHHNSGLRVVTQELLHLMVAS